MRPSDAAAAVHPHSALTLRSRFSEYRARRLVPGEVCPESTRHDSWLSRKFTCATLFGGHAARRLATERMPAGSVCAALLCRSCWIGRLLHRGAREQSLLAADARTRRLSESRYSAVPESLSLFLSLLPSLAAASAAPISGMGERSHETRCFSFSSPRCSCCTPPLPGHPGTTGWGNL